MLEFNPSNLYHNVETGRLYYLIENMGIFNGSDNDKNSSKRSRIFENLPCKVALVKSEISINLMKNMQTIHDKNNDKFVYRFEFKSKFYNLSNEHKANELVKKFSAFKEIQSE